MPFIIDVGSTGGILLNGRRVMKSALRPGDVLTIGEQQFEFRVKDKKIFVEEGC